MQNQCNYRNNQQKVNHSTRYVIGSPRNQPSNEQDKKQDQKYKIGYDSHARLLWEA